MPPHAFVADDLRTETYLPAASGPAKVRSQSASKARQPLDWDSMKKAIHDYYLVEGRTLEDTKRLMESDHGFSATTKMYKTKINQWGFEKHIAGSKARWMLQHTAKRKRESKATTFRLAGLPVTKQQIESSAKRSKTTTGEVFDETPPGITYETPSVVAYSPMSVTTPQRSGEAPLRWTPEYSSYDPSKRQPRLIWKDHTIADVREIRHEATRLQRLGDSAGAEEKFRFALSCLQQLQHPMHDDTVSLAYHLAALYATHERVKDAYAILEWMTQLHIDLWGLEDARTIAHVEKTVDLMFMWHRASEAAALVHQLWGSSRVTEADAELAPSPSAECEHTAKVEAELALSRIQAKTNDGLAEEMLRKLLGRCEKNPKQFPLQILKAWNCLTKIYTVRGDVDRQTTMLTEATHKIEDLLAAVSIKHAAVLDASLQLVKHCTQINRYDLADNIAQTIECSAERMITYNDTSAIRVLIGLGLQYQSANAWGKAQPFFEHALNASMSLLGLSDCQTSRLEQALDDGYYEMVATNHLGHNGDLRQIIKSGSKPVRRKILTLYPGGSHIGR